MFRRRIALVAVIAALCANATSLNVVAAADTASELSQARDRAAAAQADANAAAGELSAAEGRSEEIGERIGQLEVMVQAARDRAASLQDIVRQRALFAYTHPSNSNIDVIFSADNTMDAARRVQLLDRANQNDNVAVKKLDAIRSDLRSEQHELQAQRDEQKRVKEKLATKNEAVQASLVAANQARDELAARLQREQADAAAAAELARLQALRAASQPRTPATDNSSTGGGGSAGGGGAGQIITNPGGGAFQCPLSGSAYSDNYGPRGSGFHYGIDMFAPTGVPEVAVKAGTVSYVPMSGAGGNEAYLAANDGNVYYYAHMSSFVGGPRAVAQGEVIGLVGSTGNASGPHLHFEIRIGGANGQRIDPYSTLRAAGC